MGSLEVQRVSCFYGSCQVLWEVSVMVDADEIVAVVGSNGAGKTTLMRAISGLHKISSGSILWQGEEITHVPPHRIVELEISQIPEGGGIFPYMTVIENLRVGAYTKKNWLNRSSNIENVLSLFPELKDRRNQLAGTLSGGERQMLGIAKGLMASPRLLIFDEPSSGLSPKLVLLVLNAIKEIRQRGIAVLLVEQNVHHAMEMSNRIYVLENGRMIKSGAAQSLLTDDHVKRAYLGL